MEITPSTPQAPAPVKRPRHLMDPANPVRPVNDFRLTHVQQWVMSVLAVSTILHFAIGLNAAAIMMADNDQAKIGLNVLSAVFGVIAVAAGMLIHRKKLPSPWLLLGLIPGVVGLLVTYA